MSDGKVSFGFTLVISPSMKDLKRGYFVTVRHNDCNFMREMYNKFKDAGMVCKFTVKKMVVTNEEYSSKELEEYWS